MARLGLCIAGLVMLVGGCGASARDATAEAKPSVPLYSEGAAAAAADALLAAVPLPADTQRASGPPRAVAGKLGRPINIDEAKDVDRYAYWSSTDRPEAMLSFIAKKGPIPKVAYSSYGGKAGKTEGWGRPSMSRWHRHLPVLGNCSSRSSSTGPDGTRCSQLPFDDVRQHR